MKALVEIAASVFGKMLRLQIIAIIVVAVVALLLSGTSAALSAVAGGMAVIAGATFAAKITQKSKKTATAVLINLLKAEAVKMLVIVILLFITFKVYKQLVPFALIAGLAATALISGAAISNLDKTDNIIN